MFRNSNFFGSHFRRHLKSMLGIRIDSKMFFLPATPPLFASFFTIGWLSTTRWLIGTPMHCGCFISWLSCSSWFSSARSSSTAASFPFCRCLLGSSQLPYFFSITLNRYFQSFRFFSCMTLRFRFFFFLCPLSARIFFNFSYCSLLRFQFSFFSSCLISM
ncbi:membrane protein [methanotrophic bacterial endosymbiont of Bathymodiolus sp.]|nr:membrane protein [methanotrophic bacterial endosymbiont of Bathymodiolus sp.]